MRTRCLVAAWAALVGLRANDTWLQPERFAATPGATLALGLTTAGEFSGPETAVAAERVATVRARLTGEALVLPAPVPGARMLTFAATLPRPGIAVIGVELKARLVERESEQIEPYFRAIHAGEALRGAWEAVPVPRRWRESRVTQTKTFVRVGEPAVGDRGWSQPLGFWLEIVPESDPTALAAGDEFPVRVLKNGGPFAGFTLAFVSAGETREHVVETDEAGRARARLDLRGLWLVHGTDLRRVATDGVEWESDVATMVVEAK